VFIWYIFSGFGIIYQDKSGNPDGEERSVFVSKEKNTFPRFCELFNRPEERERKKNFLVLEIVDFFAKIIESPAETVQ
jgi:hypothetical protein